MVYDVKMYIKMVNNFMLEETSLHHVLLGNTERITLSHVFEDHEVKHPFGEHKLLIHQYFKSLPSYPSVIIDRKISYDELSL